MTATDRYSGPVLRYLAVLGAVAMSLALLPLVGVAQAQDADAPDNPDDACPFDPAEADFSDRDDIAAVHVNNVDCLADARLGIVQGFIGREYKPRQPVTRGQMASFIFRSLQAADVSLPPAGEKQFEDVSEGSTHDEAIHRLAAAGIVEGGPLTLDETHYGPQLRTRRDQMASFLMRAAGYALNNDADSFDTEFGDTAEPSFPDVPSTNTHYGNVEAAKAKNIAQGFEDGTYGPRLTTRRDQMASFIVRLLNFLTVPGDVSLVTEETATVTEPVTETATVTDQFGNPVESATVTFTAEHESGTATIAPESKTTTETNENGEATFTFTTDTPGTVVVTASIEEPGGNFTVTTTATGEQEFEAAAGGAGAQNFGFLPIGALSLTLPALAWRRRRESELTPLA